MNKRVLVVGHPLAAPENRLPFINSSELRYFLCIPSRWKARSLGRVYLPDEGDRERNDRFFLPVGLSGRNSLYFWLGLKKTLEKLEPDLIYCWEEPWCLSTMQVVRTASKMDIPVLFYSAENRCKHLPFPFRRVRKYVYRKSCGAVAITSEVKCRLRESGYTNSLHEIPLWIRDFPGISAKRNYKTLVYIGRLIPLKRVELLVSALGNLPEYSLQVLGDGPELRTLKKMCRNQECEDRVVFHGNVDNQVLDQSLQACSLVVLPTAHNPRQAEQFGKAALESVSMGLPVLASNTGNYKELEKALPSLFTAEFNDGAELATAIEACHRDYPSEEELQRSQRIVLDRYSQGVVSAKFAELFLDQC